MLQNNIYSGLLFLIGIFYNAYLLALAALAGTIISTATAQVLQYSKDDIRDGLYGFNGALTGIAVLCFFEPSLVTIFALVLGASLSTLLMYGLKKFIPPFTAPFVLVTWLIMYTLLLAFDFPLLSSPAPAADASFNLLSASSKSFGQVMFQENSVTGVFFLLAIAVNNKIMAAYALYAAVLGSLIGSFIADAALVSNAGLMGYNAILCAIALTGKTWRDFIWVTLAIILSTLLNSGLAMLGVITLTAPFVLITWLILQLQKNPSKAKGLVDGNLKL